MTSLEQAARQALEVLENRFNPKGYGEMDNAITALRQALEQQPKQEPVAWMSQGGDVSRSKRYFEEMGFTDLIPLYTKPPKREWVGLSNLEKAARQTLVCDPCPYLEIHDAVVKDHDKAMELLRQCVDEMRYAGWNKFVSDNTGRNAVYEQLQEFLK
jgi:hypothetical protein